MRAKNLLSIINHFAYKRLSSVECVSDGSSNQHEFHGVSALKNIFGLEFLKFPVKIIYLNDEEDLIVFSDATLSWYDARRNQQHRSSEYHLYYTENKAMYNAGKGDLLVYFQLIMEQDKRYHYIVIAPQNSTSEKQLKWLFNIESDLFANRFVNHENFDKQIDAISTRIFDLLGIDLDISDDTYLDKLIQTFGSDFPTTKRFSDFSRDFAEEKDLFKDPDGALLAYLEIEYVLFRTFEKYIVEKRLTDKPITEVEPLIKFSLSIQNRRKSRAGLSLENHLIYIFDQNKIQFSHDKHTEKGYRPDFIFPEINEYHDKSFDSCNLDMLAVKTSCKDRWRQVLKEAERVDRKHLLTLEPSISVKQTEQMNSENLQLVIPTKIQDSYDENQRRDLISLAEFIYIIKQ